MGYCEYLQQMLNPLGVYQLNGGVSGGELEALGRVLDEFAAQSAFTERECVIPTAQSFGLEQYEEILRKSPMGENLQDRREAIQALLRMDDISFTLRALNQTVSGCGIRAVIAESKTPYTVEITFPNVRGIPENLDKIAKRLEAIVPCHLNIVYVYLYTTWSEIEEGFPKWEDIEAQRLSWDALEHFMPMK